MKSLKVLIGCEFSGTVRNAFRARGHDAYSCDILDCEDTLNSQYHIKADILTILNNNWDLAIFFPPCTHLCSSGARWFTEGKKDINLQKKSLLFVKQLLDAPIPKIALENPVGVISTSIRKPDQIVQPYFFGDPFKKTTCLWLKNLPLLVPSLMVDSGKIQVCKSGKSLPEWYSNAPKKERWKIRSKTFPGLAQAMADQWGSI